MSAATITADQERARAIRALAADWKLDRALIDAEFPQPWRGYGLLPRIVFFVLTSIAIAAFYFLTRAELLTAGLCIAIAEFLIWRQRWFGTGVEEALWLGGVISAISALPSTGSPESNLLVAAVVAMAGVRVRNPLFGAVAAYFVTQYLERVRDLGTAAALVIGAAALVALYRTWKRPSTEWLFIALALTMPFAGWAHADRQWARTTIALYAAYTLLAFVSAILRRHHAMFVAATASLLIAIAVLHEHLALREELTLGITGAALLAASWLTARLLAVTARLRRGRTRGFVVTPAKLTAYDDELQSIGTIAVAGPSAGNPPEQRPQGDGGFGGAGATGDL